MPDPHHPQSGPTESGSAPVAARKGPSVYPGVLLLGGAAMLLGAYTLGYLPQIGSLLEDAIRSSRTSDLPALNPVFYGITGLAAFLILLGLLRSFGFLLRRFRDTSPLRSRAVKPVEQFIAEAAGAKISLRVAREGYYLLEPQYPHKMCIDLNDDLRRDLHLPDEAVRALDALLRTRCERRQSPVNSGASATAALPAPGLTTVFDLLQAVETATPLREERSGTRDREADTAVSTPSRERRLTDSAQRKALHAATLSAIEAGSLHPPDSSGLHRRFSDYNGPRRRATDNRPTAEYNGPYQRASDRTPERRPDRPPPGSPERKAQPAIVTSEPDPGNPVFVSPRSKHAPEATP